jgi:CBS-domain-containing membrane protein
MVNVPTVRRWMRECGRSLRPDDEMAEAIEFLTAHKCPAISVIDEVGRLVGILTEKDCLRTFCSWVYNGVSGGKVRDYMSPVKAVIEPDMDLLAVASVFLQNFFPALPVIADGKLVGMISRLEVLRGIAEWQRQREKERSARRTPGRGPERPDSIRDLREVVLSHDREQTVQRFHRT